MPGILVIYSKCFFFIKIRPLSIVKISKCDNFNSCKLKLSNLAYVGIRDIDDFEGKIIDSKNIKYFPVNMCESKMEGVIQDLDSWIEDSPIHISWDVDSLDPGVIDSTGTPVPGGITLENGKKLL